MRNLYLVDCLPEAAADVRGGGGSGPKNRAPDGLGWTNVHLIQPPSTGYSKFGLRVTDAASVLEPSLPRVQEFIATASAGFDRSIRDPWGRYDHNAYCFGFDAACFLKLEVARELVEHIWFECRTREAAKVAALRQAMVAIDALVPSAIADYWNDMAGAVQDSAFLDQYFRQLTEQE